MGGGVEDAEEIKRHPFFKNLNFELLEKKEIEPPFKPKTKGEDDYKNIDQVLFIDFLHFRCFYEKQCRIHPLFQSLT